MDKVKRAFEAGVSLTAVVKDVLADKGTSLSAMALKHGIDRSSLSAGLGGGRALNKKEIAALVAELGGTEEEWRTLLLGAVQRRLAPAVSQ